MNILIKIFTDFVDKILTKKIIHKQYLEKKKKKTPLVYKTILLLKSLIKETLFRVFSHTKMLITQRRSC